MDRRRRLLQKQLDAAIREETRLLSPKAPGRLEQTVRKAEERFPPGAVSALQKAFGLGFEKVFASGTGVIEWTIQPEKSRKAAQHAAAPLKTGRVRSGLRGIERQARRRVRGNRALTAAEGAALGLLGIGLPDIPIFVGMLLKTVYEVAVAYGFSYEPEEERLYILQLLCAALAGDGRMYSAQADRTAFRLGNGKSPDGDLDTWIVAASQQLCLRLLAVKAVQGLPLVGVVGGGFNWAVLGRTGRLARIKYRKRMLSRMLDVVQN